MAFQAHPGALVERFSAQVQEGSTKPELVVFDGLADVTRMLTTEGDKRGIQINMDMGTAEELSGGLRGVNAVTAAKQEEELNERKKKRELEARRLQALLDQLAEVNGQIDAIDEQIEILEAKIDALSDTITGLQDGSLSVEDALSDPTVNDAVKDWERRTGKRFDPNDPEAADILTAILASQIDEYGNDLAALKREKSALQAEGNRIQNEIEVVQGARATGATIAEVQPKLDEITETTTGAAYLSVEMQGDDEVADFAGNKRDQDSDAEFNATSAAADNSSDFSALGGLLSEASVDLNNQVNANFAMPEEKTLAQVSEAKVDFKVEV